jgi:hypothetical protein
MFVQRANNMAVIRPTRGAKMLVVFFSQDLQHRRLLRKITVCQERLCKLFSRAVTSGQVVQVRDAASLRASCSGATDINNGRYFSACPFQSQVSGIHSIYDEALRDFESDGLAAVMSAAFSSRSTGEHWVFGHLQRHLLLCVTTFKRQHYR